MNRKLEPHIILHLRINQDDIKSYLDSKIQVNVKNDSDKKEFKSLVYDANNIDIFSNTLLNEPIPAISDYTSQFETLNPILDTKKVIPKLEIKKEIKKEIKIESKDEKINYCLNVPHINLDKKNDVPTVNINEDENCSDVKIRLIKALGDFADSNKRKEWLKSTSVWCRWCVHSFQGPPVSIPKWYLNKTFFVTGCYCSYSCAASHLFSRNDVNETNKWKYYNLLHFLKKKILNLKETDRIQLAPPQETLQVFGGHLSIEKFRDITKETHKHYNTYTIIEPPMVSISSIIEETTQLKENMSDMRLLSAPGGVRAYGNMKYIKPKNENCLTTKWGNNKSYIPVDNDRMKRAVENLKVSRKAPLIDKKKTLLHYMNLKVKKR